MKNPPTGGFFHAAHAANHDLRSGGGQFMRHKAQFRAKPIHAAAVGNSFLLKI